MMTTEPVDLDERRGMAARKATCIRRDRLQYLRAEQAASRRRQEELEQLLLAPAETWPEAAAKAQYLINLFAATPEARDPRRKELIAQALDDLVRLCGHAAEPS